MPVIPRATDVIDVPPVCTVYWTPEDWQRVTRTVYEPLTLDGPGGPWIAVGRNDAGQILYSRRASFLENA